MARQFPSRASGVVIIDEDGRVLLESAEYRPHPFVPGGAAVADEEPLATALRELREELGVSGLALELRLVDYTGRRPGENGVAHYWYSTEVRAHELTIRPDMNEVTGWSWWAQGEAIGIVAAEYRPRLKAVLEAHEGRTRIVLR